MYKVLRVTGGLGAITRLGTFSRTAECLAFGKPARKASFLGQVSVASLRAARAYQRSTVRGSNRGQGSSLLLQNTCATLLFVFLEH
jgi:hypothetical protein